MIYKKHSQLCVLLISLLSLLEVNIANSQDSVFSELKKNQAYRSLQGIYKPQNGSTKFLYHFSYDTLKRPVRVVYKKNDTYRNAPDFGTPQITIVYTDTAEYRYFQSFDGKPLKNNNGVFIEKFLLDAKKQKKKLIFLDSAFNIIQTNTGVASIEYTTDEKGRIITEVLRNITNTIIPRAGIGFLITGFSYDSRDNMVSSYALDNHSKRTTNQDGVASIEMKWNKEGKETEWYYADLSGAIMIRKDINIARGIYSLDVEGNVLSIAYQDINKQPINYRNTTAIIIYVYDREGNFIEQRYYDKEMRLKNNWNKAALIKYEFIDGKRKEYRFTEEQLN